MPKGKTTTKKCEICNRDFSLFVYNKHVRTHLKPVAPIFTEGTCKFCEKLYTNKSGLSNHEIRCKDNPNRQLQYPSIDGIKRGIEKKIKNGTLKHTLETKNKLSSSMKLAVANNPESYTSSNRGRTKQIEYDGLKFHGNWELDFYKWTKAQGLIVERKTPGFKYIWNGERTYFPDFYIPSKDLYIEIKGYETERDRAKWSQFPKQLCVLKEREIKQIRNNNFMF